MSSSLARVLLPALLPGLLLACGDKDPDGGGGDAGDGGGDDCTEVAFFLDSDGDGHGGSERVDACEAPDGYVARSTDCDDGDASVNPDATETCDGVDEDCDGDIDEDAGDMQAFLTDADGDGFGDDDSPVMACELAEGLAEEGGDCDDAEASAYPGAVEACDGIDNDCDGSTDGASYPSDFTGSLSEAVVEVAGAGTGELLCVEPGTYAEQLVLEGVSLEVRGYGAGQTVIEGLGDGSWAIDVDGADGATVADLSAPSAYVLDSAGFSMSGVSLEGLSALVGTSCIGCALYVQDSEVSLEDVDITDAEVSVTYFNNAHGGFAYAVDSQLSWVGGQISGNTVDSTSATVSSGVAFNGSRSEVHLEDLEVSDNVYSVTKTSGSSSSTANLYGMVYVYDTDMSLVDVAVDDNVVTLYSESTASSGMGFTNFTVGLYVQESTFSWDGGSLSGNAGTGQASDQSQGLLVYATSSPLQLTDVDIMGNMVGSYGDANAGYVAGLYSNGAPHDYLRVDIRGNHLESAGASGWMQGLIGGYEADGSVLSNVVIAGNTVEAHASAYGLLSAYRYDLTVDHATIVGNELSAVTAESGVFGVEWGSLAVSNSIVAGNSLVGTTASPGAAVVAWDGRNEVSLTYSDVYDNSSNLNDDFMQGDHNTFDGLAGDGMISEDPGFVGTSGAPDGWDLTLGSGSAAVDAADPSESDADGSGSDMGAYGGPEGAW